MKLTKTEQRFKQLISVLPEGARYDLSPVIQRIDETTLGCQFKIELLDTTPNGGTQTNRKVTVLAQGANPIEAQYNALKLALVQLQLL